MDLLATKNSITSLELAELTGKRHDHVLRDIQNMEVAWQNIGQPKFGVTSYRDKSNRQRVMYKLTKSESLYVISKFKDEIRAKVILRWEELERATPPKTEDTILLEAMSILNNRIAQKEEQLLLQQNALQQAAPKVEYFDKVLQSRSTYTVNQVAKELGMSAVGLNRFLKDNKIQYRQNGTWVLYSKYQNSGYTKTKTHYYHNSQNEKCTAMSTVWTEKGRLFIHDFVSHTRSIDTL